MLWQADCGDIAGHRLPWRTPLAEEVCNVPRYCLKYTVVVLALLGLTQIWQACGDGPIASFQNLSPASHLDPHKLSASACMLAGTDAQTRRAALEPALAILDEVHPDVSRWVRDTDARGRLLFSASWKMCPDGPNCLARYDALRGGLTISPGIFAESDGRLATVLCHEYRHARQRFSKTILYALSYVVRRGGDPTIVENDALLFEQAAQLAVFGQYLDP
jgi:hypothetical protein